VVLFKIGLLFFFFNFTSFTCPRNGNSSLRNWVAGVIEVARNDLSDFLLLFIRQTIPRKFNVFMGGWFAQNLIPLSGGVVLHHPLGNVMKISASFSPLSDSSFDGIVNFTDWRINAYNVGITEPGSSGGPLINTNALIIGQVHGGFSSCNPYPGGPDYFGKFSLSFYSVGANATQKMQPFIDQYMVLLNSTLQLAGQDLYPPLPSCVCQCKCCCRRGYFWSLRRFSWVSRGRYSISPNSVPRKSNCKNLCCTNKKICKLQRNELCNSVSLGCIKLCLQYRLKNCRRKKKTTKKNPWE